MMPIDGDNVEENSTDFVPQWGQVTPLVIVAACIEAVLVVLILITNGLVLATFVHNSRLRNNVTNFYLLQLAVADFVAGLFGIMHIAFQLEPSILESVAGCLARFSSMMVTCGVAALSLLAISYDRFLAIAGPFYYRSRIRGRRILLQVLVIDAVPVVLCVLVPALWHGQVHDVCNMADVYAWPYLAYIILPLYGCVTAMQVALYSVTLTLTQKRLRLLRRLQQPFPSFEQTSSYRGSVNLTRTGALVLATFIICWLPFFITLSLQVYGGYDSYTVYWLNLAMFFLILLNCVLNPLILVWRLPLFRYQLRTMFSLRDSTSQRRPLSWSAAAGGGSRLWEPARRGSLGADSHRQPVGNSIRVVENPIVENSAMENSVAACEQEFSMAASFTNIQESSTTGKDNCLVRENSRNGNPLQAETSSRIPPEGADVTVENCQQENIPEDEVVQNKQNLSTDSHEDSLTSSNSPRDVLKLKVDTENSAGNVAIAMESKGNSPVDANRAAFSNIHYTDHILNTAASTVTKSSTEHGDNVINSSTGKDIPTPASSKNDTSTSTSGMTQASLDCTVNIALSSPSHSAPVADGLNQQTSFSGRNDTTQNSSDTTGNSNDEPSVPVFKQSIVLELPHELLHSVYSSPIFRKKKYVLKQTFQFH